MSAIILSYIIYYSSVYHIDARLVKAIVLIESGGHSEVVGAAGEIGLMQIMPSSSKLSIEKLKDPKVNISEGVKYLSQMRDICKFKENYEYVICFNTGVGGALKIKHPLKFRYYQDVMLKYNQLVKEENGKN